MAKLLITTQVYENYGSAEKPYWKAKGGMDYVVKNFTNFNAIGSYMMVLRDKIEHDTDYLREHIIDWEIVADDYLTQFERSQLQYEGKITHSPTEVFYGR